MRLYRGFCVFVLRAASPVIGNVRGISVSSAKSCRDAFSRLGKRDFRIKSPVAEAWRFAETQECVSTGFLRVCLARFGIAWFVETRRATSPVIGNVRGIFVSSTKSCRDAFLRLGTRDCRIKSPAAKAWRFAETQECVSTGVFACLSFAPRLLSSGRADSVIPARGDVARRVSTLYARNAIRRAHFPRPLFRAFSAK